MSLRKNLIFNNEAVSEKPPFHDRLQGSTTNSSSMRTHQEKPQQFSGLRRPEGNQLVPDAAMRDAIAQTRKIRSEGKENVTQAKNQALDMVKQAKEALGILRRQVEATGMTPELSESIAAAKANLNQVRREAHQGVVTARRDAKDSERSVWRQFNSQKKPGNTGLDQQQGQAQNIPVFYKQQRNLDYRSHKGMMAAQDNGSTESNKNPYQQLGVSKTYKRNS